jgi:hypothetical protein
LLGGGRKPQERMLDKYCEILFKNKYFVIISLGSPNQKTLRLSRFAPRAGDGDETLAAATQFLHLPCRRGRAPPGKACPVPAAAGSLLPGARLLTGRVFWRRCSSWLVADSTGGDVCHARSLDPGGVAVGLFWRWRTSLSRRPAQGGDAASARLKASGGGAQRHSLLEGDGSRARHGVQAEAVWRAWLLQLGCGANEV